MTPAEFDAIPTPETDEKEFPFYSDVLGDDVQVIGSKDARSLERRLHVAREALKKIASFKEGAEVTSSFDEPHSANDAREALQTIEGMKP